MNNQSIHSVSLDRDKCRGCTNCIKRCPTEAIRVRGGKAQITSDRCIDCGECIRICPHRAKKAIYDGFELLDNFKYKIALPPPSLYGQFDNIEDIDYILTGLLQIGFDDVFEVSRAAEIVSDFSRNHLHEIGVKKPVISSACPAITRLISVRYPNLCDNVLTILPPVEIAAKLARAEAKKKHPELSDGDIGIIFISPCPAKVSYIRNPDCVKKSEIDGALAISSVYFKLLGEMKNIVTPMPLARSGIIGISWAGTGGESSALLGERYLAADGIENVINVLDKIENENFAGLEFIELNACNGGCVGGALTVENAYIAKARIQKLRKYLPVSQNTAEGVLNPEDYLWENFFTYNPVMRLSNNKNIAVKMMIEMDKICKELPGIDCGACGAPSCRALAEDIVKNIASEKDCLIKLKEQNAEKMAVEN